MEIHPTLAGLTAGDAPFRVAEWRDDGESSRERPVAPPHRHLHDPEVWYVLEGRLGFTVDGEDHSVDAGGLAWVPPGAMHTYWNASDRPARYLLIAPTGVFALIDAIHAATDRSPAALRELFLRHDAELG